MSSAAAVEITKRMFYHWRDEPMISQSVRIP